MLLNKEQKEEFERIMLRNIGTTKQFEYLNKHFKHEILYSSFENPLLRFIEINGIEYPANSQFPTKNDNEFPQNFQNPFIHNIRASYDCIKKEVFIESFDSGKKEWNKIKNPLPIGKIKTIKIFTLNVKNENIDYTVYKLIIQTKN